MQHFLAYYWMKQGDRGSNLCETLTADSYTDATAQIEERLSQRFFSFISENKGRVLVVSAHVQYVEIEGINNDLPFDNPELPGDLRY